MCISLRTYHENTNCLKKNTSLVYVIKAVMIQLSLLALQMHALYSTILLNVLYLSVCVNAILHVELVKVCVCDLNILKPP